MTADERERLLLEGRQLRNTRDETGAIAIARQLLEAAPTDAQALDLFGGALAALQKGFTTALESALEMAPGQQHSLRVIRARWLTATGQPDRACAELRQVVAAAPKTAGAWGALISAASARSRHEALNVGKEAVAACPQDRWLWRQLLTMLSLAGDDEELTRRIKDHPLPAIDHPDFLRQAWLFRDLEYDEPVWNAWRSAPLAARQAFMRSRESAVLLCMTAKVQAMPGEVLDILLPMLGQVTELQVLRQGFELAVLSGDLDATNRIASELHRLSPRDHGLVPMYLLQDARIFNAGMRRAHEVLAKSAVDRLDALSRLVIDEPASLPAAMSWLMVFRAERCAPRPPRAVGSLIPRMAWTHRELSRDWCANLSDFEVRDLRNEDVKLEFGAHLPRQVGSGLARLTPAAQADILRWEALSANGGWSVAGYGMCAAPVQQLAINLCTLVAALADRGTLTPELLGVAATHPALDAVRRIAHTATTTSMGGGGIDQAVTGAPALTLGVAAWGAAAVAAQQPVPMYLLTYPQRNRLLGVGWPLVVP